MFREIKYKEESEFMEKIISEMADAMNKKIVIYGLGNVYRQYKEYLYKNYDVVGVTSSNCEEKAEHANYITHENLKNIDYDYIFICSYSQTEIVDKLVNDMNIPKNRIMLNVGLFNQNGIFHSQINEDAICLLLLNKIGVNLNEITYVDIGAWHPVQLNNTYLFYTLGGHGTLVEPNDDLKNLIEVCRPRDTLINKAISLDGKVKKYYKLQSTTLNTIGYEKLDLDYCENMKEFELQDIREIETITINELFVEIGEQQTDVMSFDIEGYNYEVLSQMNWQITRPKIIIAELNAMGEKEQMGDKIIELLESNEYILVSKNAINGIFVDRKYENEIQDFILPQMHC